jgi:protocatechuate 3,4-dioxygenase beta subunit
MSRRSLGMFLGAGTAAALAACTPGGTSGSATSAPAAGTSAASAPTTSAAATTTSSASPTLTRAIAECGVEIPQETSGPFPGDGSNGPNVLEASGVVRQDITSSFGTSTSKAEGVPLTVTLTLLDNANGCTPLAGAAVYAWHCDREGRYSMYDSGLQNENYLRGVQEADANGQVTFKTIYPSAYSGRWPHIHFEIYDSLDEATTGRNSAKTSQLAMPAAACNQVYGVATGYDASVSNFAKVSLSTDGVFSDTQAATQLATVTGSNSAGYAATLTVGISA